MESSNLPQWSPAPIPSLDAWSPFRLEERWKLWMLRCRRLKSAMMRSCQSEADRRRGPRNVVLHRKDRLGVPN